MCYGLNYYGVLYFLIKLFPFSLFLSILNANGSKESDDYCTFWTWLKLPIHRLIVSIAQISDGLIDIEIEFIELLVIM